MYELEHGHRDVKDRLEEGQLYPHGEVHATYRQISRVCQTEHRLTYRVVVQMYRKEQYSNTEHNGQGMRQRGVQPA
jgi:hypothetical protein